MKKGRVTAILLALVMFASMFAAIPVLATDETADTDETGILDTTEGGSNAGDSIIIVESDDNIIGIPGNTASTGNETGDESTAVDTSDEVPEEDEPETRSTATRTPTGTWNNVSNEIDLNTALADTSSPVVINISGTFVSNTPIVINGPRHVTINITSGRVIYLNVSGTGITLSGGAVLNIRGGGQNSTGTLSISGTSGGIHATGVGTAFTIGNFATVNASAVGAVGSIGARAEAGASITLSSASATSANGIGASATGGSYIEVTGSASSNGNDSYAASASGINSRVVVRGDAKGLSGDRSVGARAVNGGHVYICGDVDGSGNDILVDWVGYLRDDQYMNQLDTNGRPIRLLFPAPLGGHWWLVFHDETNVNRINSGNAPAYIYLSDAPIALSYPGADNDITEFVSSLYWQALGRGPIDAGAQNFRIALQSGAITGADAAAQIFLSDEGLRKIFTYDGYVNALYWGLLGRGPDANGGKAHVDLLREGSQRENAFASLVNSQEFKDRCYRAGIIAGSYTPPPGNEISIFVTRLYRSVLGRADIMEPDQLRHWVNTLRLGNITGATAAHGMFFDSINKEYKNRNRSNYEFVTDLYYALFRRTPSAEERKTHDDVLSIGWPRENVFAGFANSGEFTVFCNQAGIVRGTYTPPSAPGPWVYVTRLYMNGLGRTLEQVNADEAGLAGNANVLINRTVTATQLAHNFFESNEYAARGRGNTMYIQDVYRALLNRLPTASEQTAWETAFANSTTTRWAMLGSVAGTNEFLVECNRLGIRR